MLGYSTTKWYSGGYYEDDTPIVLQEVPVCMNWKCQKFDENNEPVGPVLVRNDKGFRICPACGASHGK